MDWWGILIGGVITLLVSLVFYVPAARSLKRETARLRRHTTLILRGLEEAGLVEYHRDERGDIVGISFKRPVSDTISVADNVEVNLESRRKEERDTDAPADPN